MTDPVRAAAKGRCPRCGTGPLYDGLLKLRPACASCGLDFSAFNVGDGPAAFLIMIIGGITVGLALWVELSWSPPFWVHILLWGPFVLAGTLASLRVSKGLLLGLEFRHKAAEGRLDDTA